LALTFAFAGFGLRRICGSLPLKGARRFGCLVICTPRRVLRPDVGDPAADSYGASFPALRERVTA
jgi:hypothetical protein